MPMPRFACRRLGLAVALAGAVGALGTATAAADPDAAGLPAAAPPVPRGMPQVISDVLGPEDPAFWNPAIPGTRVLTPLEPRAEVICATGFVPVISCSTVNRWDFDSRQRSLEFVDLPVIGGPPLRVWFEVPRLGDGSTREPVHRAVTWWLTDRTLS